MSIHTQLTFLVIRALRFVIAVLLFLDCLFSMLAIKYSAWRQNSCFVFSKVGSLYNYVKIVSLSKAIV